MNMDSSTLFYRLKIYREFSDYYANHKELEYIIACHSEWAFIYARFYKRDRFQLAEGMLHEDDYYCQEYYRFVVTL